MITLSVSRLTPTQSRGLAIGLLVAAVVLCVGVLVMPFVLLHKHYDDVIDSLDDRLGRYRRVAAQAPEYRNGLEAMREKDGRRFFLKNTAPNLAGAELQEIARNAIESQGGRITTSQTPAPKGDGRFKQISVNMQFFATTPTLQRILHVLEAQQPLLVVENLTLRPLNAFRGFKPGPGQEPEINVQMEVSAFALGEVEKK